MTGTRRTWSGGLLLAAAALIAVGLVAWGGLHFAQRRRDEALRASHSVTEAVKAVARLATVEMTVSNWQLRRDSKQLFGFLPFSCEKSVAILYKGRVSAGFDLAPERGPGLHVMSEPERRRVVVRLPAPRVLTVEVPAPEIVVADGSVCNRLEPSEYRRLHEEARGAVTKEAIASGLLGKAKEQARTLVRGIVEPFGFALDLQIEEAPPLEAHGRDEPAQRP